MDFGLPVLGAGSMVGYRHIVVSVGLVECDSIVSGWEQDKFVGAETDYIVYFVHIR